MQPLDLTAISSDFNKNGGEIFRKKVNEFDLAADGIRVYKNVNAPIRLPKLSAKGNPKPYKTAAETNNNANGAKVTERMLTAHQSKWDFDIDPEDKRNTFLADQPDQVFNEYIIDQVCTEYLAAINDNTAYLGVRDANGTDTADIADGWGTIIAAEIVAGNITPVVTGAITAANAVTKVELVADSVPAWMKKQKFFVYCSWDVFQKYRTHYRTLNAFGFDKNEKGEYALDGSMGVLKPVSWMGASQRLIATLPNNLVMGTDGERIQVATSVSRNIIESRPMLPVGFEICDLDCLFVNDQA